jgi:hypothetical protein
LASTTAGELSNIPNEDVVVEVGKRSKMSGVLKSENETR